MQHIKEVWEAYNKRSRFTFKTLKEAQSFKRWKWRISNEHFTISTRKA